MNDSVAVTDQLTSLLGEFRPAGVTEAETLAEFSRFVAAHADCCERTLSIGHCTGSAWLVSADGYRVLLTHHRKLQRWLQLGGHADGDRDLAAVALREAEEESGLPGLVLEGGVFDLDRHFIPERGNEVGHWHYDLRFVVRATHTETFAVNEESLELAWRDIAQIAGDAQADESLRRMARKWLGR